MRQAYVGWIDWLKCIGLTLVVAGHLAHSAVAGLLPPIYPKQLGVALFLYATAYSLARERRPPWRVFVNRLFEVYVFGLAAAVILSAAGYLAAGDIRESNYLPLLFGVNVLLDYFPANPTTWYIGTYIHVLLLWAVVLRHVRVRPWMIAATLLLEISVRAMLLDRAGAFIAYMMVPNWATVLLVGLMRGQDEAERPARGSFWPPALGLAAFLGAWSAVIVPIARTSSFPLMRFFLPMPFDLIATSAAVSAVYLCCTLFTVAIVRPLGAPELVRFVARNTVVVFIGHMPLFYALHPVTTRMTSSYWWAFAMEMLVCYVGLLLLSERLRRMVNPPALREWLVEKVSLVGSRDQGSGKRAVSGRRIQELRNQAH